MSRGIEFLLDPLIALNGKSSYHYPVVHEFNLSWDTFPAIELATDYNYTFERFENILMWYTGSILQLISLKVTLNRKWLEVRIGNISEQ